MLAILSSCTSVRITASFFRIQGPGATPGEGASTTGELLTERKLWVPGASAPSAAGSDALLV